MSYELKLYFGMLVFLFGCLLGFCFLAATESKQQTIIIYKNCSDIDLKQVVK